MPETVINQGAILAGRSEAKPLSPLVPIPPPPLRAVGTNNSRLEAKKPRFQETAWYILADVRRCGWKTRVKGFPQRAQGSQPDGAELGL